MRINITNYFNINKNGYISGWKKDLPAEDWLKLKDLWEQQHFELEIGNHKTVGIRHEAFQSGWFYKPRELFGDIIFTKDIKEVQYWGFISQNEITSITFEGEVKLASNWFSKWKGEDEKLTKLKKVILVQGGKYHFSGNSSWVNRLFVDLTKQKNTPQTNTITFIMPTHDNAKGLVLRDWIYFWKSRRQT